MYRAIFFVCCCLGLAITSTSNALTFKTGKSAESNKRDSANISAKCDPERGESYIFDDPQAECVNPNHKNWKVTHKRSRQKNEKAFPAYYQLKKQSKSLVLPAQYHLYEWHEQYHKNPNFTFLPACKDRRGVGKNVNPSMVPVYFPKMVSADTSVNYAGGKNNEVFDKVSLANMAVGMACQGGDAAACDKIVDVLHEAARNDKLQFDNKLQWRHQTAYLVNNHLLLPTLNFYSFAIAKAPSWNKKIHAEIGEWLARVLADSDEYVYYGFGYHEGPVWQEMKAISNHISMQAAVRMAYGILWGDKDRVTEGLNIYKYRLETIREDASMPSETRRGTMALHYQNQGITDIVIIAEMAASIGIDLYSYKNKRGQDIHDVAEFVVRTHIEDDLIREYASARVGEGWHAKLWPEFNRKKNWLGQKGTWYHLYKIRFPNSPLHEIINRDKTGNLYLYNYSTLSVLNHPTNPGANPFCLAQRPVELDPMLAENEVIFGEPKLVWDVYLSNIEQLDDNVVGVANIETLIAQHLPVRDFDVHFQIKPSTRTGQFALFAGVSNDGNLDSTGKPFSFAMDQNRANMISTRCGVTLYETDGDLYPTFSFRDVMQTTDPDRPVVGLSDQALCQIKEYGRYTYAEMVHMLSLIAKGVQGQVEGTVHTENPKAMKLLQGLQLPQ